MFNVLQVILVKDKVLFPENIQMISEYLDLEIDISNHGRIPYPEDFIVSNTQKLSIMQQILKMELFREEMDSVIYSNIQKLLKVKLSHEEMDKLIYDSNCQNNPILESKDIIHNLQEKRPEQCACIVVKYDDIILGSIMVIVDTRLKIKNETIGYFIGIRKSASLLACQLYLRNNNINSPLTNFKLSEYIIPEVEKYARSNNASYVAVTPLSIMRPILTKFFGFSNLETDIICEYEPTCKVIIGWNLGVLYKKIKLDPTNKIIYY